MRIAVVGAGMGGLAAAVELAAAGHEVEVFELADAPGGKVATASADGVEFDTGPSVLTMPEVLDAVFESAGTSIEEELELVRRDPWFRYIYPDGVELEIHHDLDRTLDAIERALGTEARDEFEAFLEYARRIWEAAAPNFIFAPAPSAGSLVTMGLRRWRDLVDIDPMRTMQSAIASRVSDWHLRWLLARYATYVGSDPRRAPATLNCIAWLELGRGSWGVRGGMHRIARALERCARRCGAEFRWETPVRRIAVDGAAASGVGLDDEVRAVDAVVVNGELRHLGDELLPGEAASTVDASAEPSMSGWTAILRASRQADEERCAHTVLFPENYEREFIDIFDRGRPPRDPTLYLCAQERAHGREGWPDGEPIFAMVNAPPVEADDPTDGWDERRGRVLERMRNAGLVGADDAVVWERTPAELAERFPGSRGAIYGAASNSRFAAFERPANDLPGVDGLYVAGGGAHPGGGVPMCLQSGRLAAEAVVEGR